MRKIFFYFLAALIIPVFAAELFAAQSTQMTVLKITTKGSTVSLEASGAETAGIEIYVHVSKGGVPSADTVEVALKVSSESSDLPPIEMLRSESSSYELTLPKGHSYFITATPPEEIIKDRKGSSVRRWGGPQTKVVPDLERDTVLMFYFEDGAS